MEFTPADFDRDKSFIRDRLREELYITAFSKEDSDRIALQNDPEVLRVLDQLPASKTMLDHLHEAGGEEGGFGGTAAVARLRTKCSPGAVSSWRLAMRHLG